MADLHILDFYKDSALILMSLQRVFPRKLDLFVEDLIGPDPVDEFGLHSKRHEACLGAMLWLADEGYLRYASTIRQEGIDQAILSEQTVIKLNAVVHLSSDQLPENLSGFEAEEHFTMIEHMRRAIQSQSSEQVATVMRAFFKA